MTTVNRMLKLPNRKLGASAAAQLLAWKTILAHEYGYGQRRTARRTAWKDGQEIGNWCLAKRIYNNIGTFSFRLGLLPSLPSPPRGRRGGGGCTLPHSLSPPSGQLDPLFVC